MQSIKRVFSSDLSLSLSFVVALVLSSNISVPFYPVPFTLQTMMVMLAVLYKREVAFQSSLIYVVLGAIGLPVFADFSAGAHILVGPTGGYLIGFIVATFIIKHFAIKSKIGGLILFNIVLFSCGVAQLSAFVGINNAIHGGFIMFILPELAKTGMAYLIYKFINKGN